MMKIHYFPISKIHNYNDHHIARPSLILFNILPFLISKLLTGPVALYNLTVAQLILSQILLLLLRHAIDHRCQLSQLNCILLYFVELGKVSVIIPGVAIRPPGND